MSVVAEPRLEFQPMKVDDLDEVLAIEISACPFPWGRGNFMDSLLSGHSGWVGRKVGEIAGEMVGYFIVMQVVDEAHLLSISVSRKFQGQGFGRHLLHRVFAVARECGSKSVLLEVRPSNDAALALYRRSGFQQIGCRRDYYPANGGREDALVLRCALDEVDA